MLSSWGPGCGVPPLHPQADVWCKYAELELAAANLESLRAIFQRCLMVVPCLELWALYMKFIRRINKGKGAAWGLLDSVGRGGYPIGALARGKGPCQD